MIIMNKSADVLGSPELTKRLNGLLSERVMSLIRQKERKFHWMSHGIKFFFVKGLQFRDFVPPFLERPQEEAPVGREEVSQQVKKYGIECLGIYKQPEVSVFEEPVIEIDSDKIWKYTNELNKGKILNQYDPVVLFETIFTMVVIHELCHFIIEQNNFPQFSDKRVYKSGKSIDTGRSVLHGTVQDIPPGDAQKPQHLKPSNAIVETRRLDSKNISFVEESLCNAFALNQEWSPDKFKVVQHIVENSPEGYRHGVFWKWDNEDVKIRTLVQWKNFKSKKNLGEGWLENFMDSIKAEEEIRNFEFITETKE